MIVLVINCGSSSIKYQLLDMKSESAYELLAKGIVEKIGLPDGHFKYTPTGKDKVEMTLPIPDHKVGMQIVLEELVKPGTGVLESFEDIEAVGHRIVQGADYFSGSALIDDDVLKKIEICCDFAPLHNPAHILGIRAVQAVIPSVPQVVTFDTAFHQTMLPHAYMYALPYEYYEKYGVRRYGAHGTSHQFVSQKGAKLAGVDLENSKIITCHLGNGSSIAAVENGKCVMTSMGLTPLEGIMMGTRSGDVDGGAVTFLQKKLNLDADGVSNYFNKKSGLAGISCKSSDMREVFQAASEGDAKCKLAIDMYTYRIKKYIGSYAAALGGCDVLVFTAGVCENQADIREAVCEDMEWMGIKLDKEKNAQIHGEEAIISTPDSKVKVVVIPTDEELMIASDTMELVK